MPARPGPHLFVPTDDGVVRIEIVQGAIVQTRTFAETAAARQRRPTGSPSRAGGLDVRPQPRRDPHAPHLKENP